jgi:hypothetical protein
MVIIFKNDFEYSIFIEFIPNHSTCFYNIFEKLLCKHIKEIYNIIQVLTLKHEKPNIDYTFIGSI